MSDQIKRILVTGSREWTDAGVIRAVIRHEVMRLPTAIVVHGAARGADLMAGAAARALGLTEERYLAQWTTLGRGAGIIRNMEMIARGADVCLAFIKDNSPGATHCARMAEQARIPVKRWTA